LVFGLRNPRIAKSEVTFRIARLLAAHLAEVDLHFCHHHSKLKVELMMDDAASPPCLSRSLRIETASLA
jgi:hypothetical protein